MKWVGQMQKRDHHKPELEAYFLENFDRFKQAESRSRHSSSKTILIGAKTIRFHFACNSLESRLFPAFEHLETYKKRSHSRLGYLSVGHGILWFKNGATLERWRI